MERLQKVLSEANIASRRKAEILILEGHVKVNGEKVTELGVKVSKNDIITVDDIEISKEEKVYYLLNKPVGYVSTTSDDKKRQTVIDLLSVKDQKKRVYPVGRLDYDTAGLLLLTNDGQLTEYLTRPNYHVEKEYLVRVEGITIKETIRTMRKGIKVENYISVPKVVQIVELDKTRQTSLLRVVLTEGKNRQIRKMMEAIGHPVKKLTRVRYDFLTLEGVERGEYRQLSIHEVKKLYRNKTNK